MSFHFYNTGSRVFMCRIRYHYQIFMEHITIQPSWDTLPTRLGPAGCQLFHIESGLHQVREYRYTSARTSIILIRQTVERINSIRDQISNTISNANTTLIITNHIMDGFVSNDAPHALVSQLQ